MILCKPRGTWSLVLRELQGTCEREQPRQAPETDRPAWAPLEAGGSGKPDQGMRSSGHLGKVGVSKRIGSEDGGSTQAASTGSSLVFWRPASSISGKTSGPICLSSHSGDVQGQFPGDLAGKSLPPPSQAGTEHFQRLAVFFPSKVKDNPTSSSTPPPITVSMEIRMGCSNSLIPK